MTSTVLPRRRHCRSPLHSAYPHSFMEKMQAHRVEGQFGGTTLDFGAGTEPVVTFRNHTAFPSQAGKHQSHGLLGRTSAWACQAHRADGEVSAEAGPAAHRHCLDHWRAN